MKQALIIFIKNPVAGQVKTRLAAQVGPAKALEVYLKLLQHTRGTALQIACDRYLFSTGGNTMSPWEHFIPAQQVEGDLGEKMFHAFTSLFNKKYDRVIIIGSDCPGLNPLHINKAFDQLNHADVVLGPATDGGYYLLGLKKMIPEIFNGISWSSDQVLNQTLATLKQLSYSYKLLEYLTDVDEYKDLPASYLQDLFLPA